MANEELLSVIHKNNRAGSNTGPFLLRLSIYAWNCCFYRLSH